MAKSLEQKMCKYSIGYAFVRTFIVMPVFYYYYRKIHVIGANDVPDKGPVIFTPNHQNALMDAMCVLCTKNRQPVFIARADIFKNPFVSKLLHFLRILPIYRRRDGVNTSDHNIATFNILLKSLHCGMAVGVMPEGTHNEIRQLKMLQKGVFRFAMQAQTEYGNLPGIKIVPVGLEYSDTRKFRSSVIIKYGKTIEMSDYFDLFTENPNRAYRVLQDTLTEKMREGMIDIRNNTYYKEIERIRVFYCSRAIQRANLNFRDPGDHLTAQQRIIAGLQDLAVKNPGKMEDLCMKIRQYLEILDKRRLRDWVIAKPVVSLFRLTGWSLLMVIGLPFWILGILFNYPPYKIAEISSRQIKDPQFISSVQFVIGMILFDIYYIILAVLFIVFIPCIWGKILMITLLIPTGLFAYNYYLSLKKLSSALRFYNGIRHNDQELTMAVDLREKIFETLDKDIDI